MSTVYLSLGSNIDRQHNIRLAVQTLFEHFGSLQISPVYESEAVGFNGDAFFNLIVGIETSLSLAELSARLKKIEDEQGRDRSVPKFSARCIDIDIVTYDNLLGEHSGIELPRPELYYNAFVLKPFADLCPEFQDPKSGLTLAELWKAYEGQQKLWQTPLAFDCA